MWVAYKNILVNLDKAPIVTVTGSAIRFQEGMSQTSAYCKFELESTKDANAAFSEIQHGIVRDLAFVEVTFAQQSI